MVNVDDSAVRGYELDTERKRIDEWAARVAEAERQLRDLWAAQHDDKHETMELFSRVARLECGPEDERVPLLDRIKGLEKRVLSLELDEAYDCPMPEPQPVSDAYTLDQSRLQRVCEALDLDPSDAFWAEGEWDAIASGKSKWHREWRDALLWRVMVALAERDRGSGKSIALYACKPHGFEAQRGTCVFNRKETPGDAVLALASLVLGLD